MQVAAEGPEEISLAAAAGAAVVCISLGFWFLFGSKFSVQARGFGLFLVVCGFFALGSSGQPVQRPGPVRAEGTGLRRTVTQVAGCSALRTSWRASA